MNVTRVGSMEGPEPVRHSWSRDPEVIFERAYPLLLSTATRLLRPSEGAEDLVQEAVVETLSRHPDFRGIEHPVGYVRTVMFRLASRRFQRQQRFEEIPTDIQELLDEPSHSQGDDALLVAAIAGSLPRRQRACVVLRYAYDLDDRTIGAIIGCAESTVRSQVARGLASLRKGESDEQS